MNRSRRNLLSGLYAITEASITDNEKILDAVKQALSGGACIIQFRNKSDNHEQRLLIAQALRKLTEQNNALLIVNDDVELAKEIHADGVHLGQDDSDLNHARQRLGQNSIIGISCYNRFELAEQAAKQGADYVAFGSFFPSRTKPEAVEANIELIQRAKQELDIPVVAIGGITTDNGRSLVEAGADMLAVVEGVFGQADIESAARNLCLLFNR